MPLLKLLIAVIAISQFSFSTHASAEDLRHTHYYATHPVSLIPLNNAWSCFTYQQCQLAPLYGVSQEGDSASFLDNVCQMAQDTIDAKKAEAGPDSFSKFVLYFSGSSSVTGPEAQDWPVYGGQYDSQTVYCDAQCYSGRDDPKLYDGCKVSVKTYKKVCQCDEEFVGSKCVKIENTRNGLDWEGSVVTYKSQSTTMEACQVLKAVDKPKEELGRSCPLEKGNPITVATGEKVQRELDYIGAGPNPLVHERVYTTKINNQPDIASFDAVKSRWTSIEPFIYVYPQEHFTDDQAIVVAHRPSCGSFVFIKRHPDLRLSTETWYRPSPAPFEFEGNVGSGFSITRRDGVVENYDASGRLIKQQTARQGVLSELLPDSLPGDEFIYEYYHEDAINPFNANKLHRKGDGFGRWLTYSYNEWNEIAVLTDPEGNETYYEYDDIGNLVMVIYPDDTPLDLIDNPRRQYLYEDERFKDHLTGIVDESGQRFASWAYDELGRALSSEHGDGIEKYNFSYNEETSDLSATHSTTTVRDAWGGKKTYSFTTLRDGIYRLRGVEDGCQLCGGGVSEMQYYNAHNELPLVGLPYTRTDVYGSVTRYKYHGNGLLRSREDAYDTSDERTTTYEWNSAARLLTAVNSPGRRMEYTYDPDTLKVSTQTAIDTSRGTSRTVSFTYYTENDLVDADNNTVGIKGFLKTVDGPHTDKDDVTTYTYRDDGTLHTVTNASGHVTEITSVDAHGRPIEIVDANGITTILNYDVRGRVDARTVGGETTYIEYYDTGDIERVTLPNGSALTYFYDVGRRLERIEDNMGNAMTYSRSYRLDGTDENGDPVTIGEEIVENVIDASGELKRTQTQLLNSLQLLESVLGANGQSTDFTYTINNELDTQLVDGRLTTSYTYDVFRRIDVVTDPILGTTDYGYDVYGNLSSVTDPESKTTTYTYNALGDLLSLSSPDTGTTTYTYDDAGNRETQTDANGVTVTYRYDALNRLTAIEHADSAYDVSFTYDVAPEGSYGIGRLTAVTDQLGTTSYHYNPRGTLRESSQTIGSQTFVTSYEYDAADNLVAITYPSSRRIDYARNALGQIEGVSTTIAAEETTLASGLTYLPFGPQDAMTYGNGLARARTFDLDYRISTDQVGALLNRSYGYNTDNTIGDITDLVNAAKTQSFTYDDLLRLDTSSGNYGLQDFEYDGIGNRLNIIDDTTDDTYSYVAGTHHLDAITDTASNTVKTQFGYDNVGNTTQKGDQTFNYNPNNRLESVYANGSLIATYTYNAQGERQQKMTTLAAPQGISTTYYHYDLAGQLIAESNAAGQLVREYLYVNGQRLAMFVPSSELITAGESLAAGEYDFVLNPQTGEYSVTEVINNIAPISNAGTDQSVLTGDAVFFDGRASSDPDGDELSYLWSTGQTTSTFTHTYTQAGTYTVSLTVTDPLGESSTDSVEITVTDPDWTANYPTMHLVGSMNGWSTTASPMTLVANNTWQLDINLAANDEMKFVPVNWSLSFGDRDGNGVADTTGGGNITVPNGAGPYRVTFNDQTLTYSLELNVGPQPPIANAGANQSVKVGTTVTLNGGQSTDPDNDIASYTWSGGFGTGQSVSKLMDTVGNFTITLTVTDSEGNDDTAQVQITVNPNQAPTVSAGSDQTIRFDQASINLNGSASDSDGSVVSYAWTQTAGAVTVIDNTSSATTTASNPGVGNYTFVLAATDDNGDSATDSINITVVDNQAPIANAGGDIATTIDQVVTFNGTASNDPDGSIASYSWTSNAWSGEKTAAQPSHTFTSEGTYLVELTVTDNNGAASIDTVSVNVTNAPTNSNQESMHVVGSMNGWDVTATPMTLVADYTWQVAVDLAAADQMKFVPVNWSLSYGDTNGDGIADSSGGGNILTPDGAGPYIITFNDDSLVYSLTLNTGPQPPVANAGANQSVKVGSTVTLNGSQSTDPDDDIVGYSWSDGFGSGQIVSQTMDTVGVINVTLTVTDSEGATDTDDVQITVNPNQAPNANAGNDQTVRFDQAIINLNGSASDSDGTVVSYAWVQTSGATVAINNADAASASLASNPGVGSYTFQLTVTDDNGDTNADSMTLTIVENTPPTANAGANISSNIDQTVTFNGTLSNDGDGSIATYSWTSTAWSGEKTGAQPSHTFTTAGTYTVSLTVTDNNGATSTDTVEVSISAVQPESVYGTMNLVGGFNNWNIGTTPMTLTTNYTWEVTVTFTDRLDFKFVPVDWGLSYGDNDANGVADSNGGGNIFAPSTGTYRIIFNDQTKAYSFSAE